MITVLLGLLEAFAFFAVIIIVVAIFGRMISKD